MGKLIAPIAALTLAVVLTAVPVAAETFTVFLTNGTTFLSRYQPQEAAWDSELVLLMTEFGNWIAIPRSEISGIESATEAKGFGKLIDTTTIDLGWAPNDLSMPDEDAQSPLDLLQSMIQQERPNYDQNQFVSPRNVGGGLPVGFASGLGGGGGGSVIALPGGPGGGSAPAPPAPSGGQQP